MLQRIALYTALGLLLSALQVSFEHWAFWCTLALFWASEHLSRREGYETGLVQGLDIYKAMTAAQRTEIDQLLDSDTKDKDKTK